MRTCRKVPGALERGVRRIIARFPGSGAQLSADAASEPRGAARPGDGVGGKVVARGCATTIDAREPTGARRPAENDQRVCGVERRPPAGRLHIPA